MKEESKKLIYLVFQNLVVFSFMVWAIRYLHNAWPLFALCVLAIPIFEKNED